MKIKKTTIDAAIDTAIYLLIILPLLGCLLYSFFEEKKKTEQQEELKVITEKVQKDRLERLEKIKPDLKKEYNNTCKIKIKNFQIIQEIEGKQTGEFLSGGYGFGILGIGWGGTSGKGHINGATSQPSKFRFFLQKYGSNEYTLMIIDPNRFKIVNSAKETFILVKKANKRCEIFHRKDELSEFIKSEVTLYLPLEYLNK